METTEAKNLQDVEHRKSSAAMVLRWMDDEITRASEDYIRGLDDNLAICLCRTALDKVIRSGEKMSVSILTSLDGNRLNYLHLAVAHDTSDADGRRNAGENTVRASRFLALEHKLIDSKTVQYTVAPDAMRIGNQSRQNRANAARHIMAMIDEMRHG